MPVSSISQAESNQNDMATAGLAKYQQRFIQQLTEKRRWWGRIPFLKAAERQGRQNKLVRAVEKILNADGQDKGAAVEFLERVNGDFGRSLTKTQSANLTFVTTVVKRKHAGTRAADDQYPQHSSAQGTPNGPGAGSEIRGMATGLQGISPLDAFALMPSAVAAPPEPASSKYDARQHFTAQQMSVLRPVRLPSPLAVALPSAPVPSPSVIQTSDLRSAAFQQLGGTSVASLAEPSPEPPTHASQGIGVSRRVYPPKSAARSREAS